MQPLAESLVIAVPSSDPVPEAERELLALCDGVLELEQQVRSISGACAAFEQEYERQLAPELEALRSASRLSRRLARLEGELEAGIELRADAMRKRARKAGRASAFRVPPLRELGPSEAPRPKPTAKEHPYEDLKELYRHLARRLHPDRGRTEGERHRMSAAMARLNAAYAAKDRVGLELIAADLATRPARDDHTTQERHEYAAQRLLALRPLLQSMQAELERLRSMPTYSEMERAAGDRARYYADARFTLMSRTREAITEVVERISRLEAKSWRFRATRKALRGDLVREAVVEPGRQRLTIEGRRCLDSLSATAATEPWQTALVLFAFFAEVAARPLDALVALSAFRERFEMLRTGWPGAPSFDRALARLPVWVDFGMRSHPGDLRFGLQLRESAYAAGVQSALRLEPVREVARAVLGVLGPKVSCRSCSREVVLVHLLRLHGLDPVHGLVCPLCKSLHSSYRVVGRPEGLESLNRYAIATGALVEHEFRLSGTALRYQLLPNEWLTARELKSRFVRGYIETLAPQVDPKWLHFRSGSARVRPSARLPRDAAVILVLDDAAELTERELLQALRKAVSRRFPRKRNRSAPRTQKR